MEHEPVTYRLCSLREDVLVETDAEGVELVLTAMWGDIKITDPSTAVRNALERMSMGPVVLDNILPRERSERARVERILEFISGCTVHQIGVGNMPDPLLSVVPIARRASFHLPKIEPRRPVRLSRFATLRTVKGEMLVESPLARHRVVVHQPLAAQLLGLLGRPTAIGDLADTVNAPDEVVKGIVAYLSAAGMVLVGFGDSPATALFAEDHDPQLIPWSHHELLFHSRSRIGRHDNPLGMIGADHQRVEVAPAVKPLPDGPRIPLYRPELDEVTFADPPLTNVIESNRHVRDFSGGAPTVQQVGELLYRAARIRSTTTVGSGSSSYVVTDRPYPSVANRYELDLYLTVDQCVGLDRGIYHYDPQGHALTLINSSEPHRRELLDVAMVAAGSPQLPPVLITMTARMARFACAYGGIAYSTVLEHVGVLQQTLHLIATAMGLAPCALAFGDNDVATDAFFIDWPAEVSVGELALGTGPDGRSAIAHSAESACVADAKRHLTVADRLSY